MRVRREIKERVRRRTRRDVRKLERGKENLERAGRVAIVKRPDYPSDGGNRAR